MMLSYIKNRIIAIAPYVCIIVLFCVLYSKCQSNKVQLANIKALNSDIKTYKLKNGQLVLSKDVLQYTNQQLKESVLSKDAAMKEMASKFSKIKIATNIIGGVKVDSLPIVYRDTVPFEFDRQGEIHTKEYSVNYNSNQQGVLLSNLKVPDTLTIISGIKKKWFWGEEKNVVDITNSNKCVIIETVNQYETAPKKKFWETNWFKVGVGFVTGILITR